MRAEQIGHGTHGKHDIMHESRNTKHGTWNRDARNGTRNTRNGTRGAGARLRMKTEGQIMTESTAKQSIGHGADLGNRPRPSVWTADVAGCPAVIAVTGGHGWLARRLPCNLVSLSPV